MKSESQSDVEYLTSENLKGLPFSEAVRMGNVLYLSGQMGIDKSVHLISGGIAEETRQALENIKTTLEKYGSSLEHVIKVTVMMADCSVTSSKRSLSIRSVHGQLLKKCRAHARMWS